MSPLEVEKILELSQSIEKKVDSLILSKKQSEQKLIDIMFEIGLIIKSNDMLQKMSNDELAEWIATQLRECGYGTTPCGASWGVL
jgi:hypothetical protein